MGKYFSDVVEKAIADIYYCYDSERAAGALAPLAAASNAGDGDAAYILSRCLSGPQYSWRYHPFVADDEGVERLIRRSITLGSAIGVLGAMRCGLLTPEMEEAMPFASLQEAWNVVRDKAQDGDPFCQNMIGNTYFWLDVVRIQGKGPNDFPTREAYGDWLRETELKCVPWFEKAFQGGMGFAGRNLYNLYHDGEEGLIQPDKTKAEAVAQQGAQLGYPEWQKTYADLLRERDGWSRQVFDLYSASVRQGQLSSWYYVGLAFEKGEVVGKDWVRALECYELGLEDPGEIGCANLAGRLLFLGENGIPQDYARAVQLFEQAREQGKNYWGSDMLGCCYLFGWGCQKDPAKALARLQEFKRSTDLSNYGLGLIYADGLGVPEDIKKGVGYLQQCRGYAPAQEALLRFKKTLFGKWVRR